MYTYALRRLVEACDLTRTLPRVFLAPTSFRYRSRATPFYSKHISGHNRQFASAAATSFPPYKTINNSLRANSTILDELKRSRDPKVWAAFLDLYLPENLRNPRTELVTEGQTIRDVQDVPLILEQARETRPDSLDLLGYLGIHQKRWKAVVWLVKAILSFHTGPPDAREDFQKLQPPFWPDFGMTLNELTCTRIWADDIIRPLESGTFDHEMLCKPSRSVYIAKASLGQVWQSVAYMILQAADHPEGASESKVIMYHVFQILAHMHHIDAIPDSIYIPSQGNDPSMIQRPPTLNLFSSRITAILSDTARRAHDLDKASELTSVRAEHSYKGHDLSEGSQRCHLREVNIGIWLDLVLWSCIEGGWITEAVWIATEVDRRRIDNERSWSVIRWETLKDQEIPQTRFVVETEQENTKSRVHQIAGDDPAIANSDGETSLVSVPPHTISREVIIALLDGLANTAIVTDPYNNSAEALSLNISICKRLLATEGFGLETHVLNCLIVRIVDQIGFDVLQRRPMELERLLLLLPSHPNEIEASMSQISANRLYHELEIANCALWLSLLRLNLYLFARSRDINNTLQTFYKQQCLTDDIRNRLIKDFAVKVNQDEWSDSAVDTSSMTFLSHIPIYVLSELLFIVTNEKLFEFGKWLLFSKEVDGATIPPEFYSQPSLQLPLLRFAAATADTELQSRLIEKLDTPFSRPVLRTLLHCQLTLNKWDSAEQLILYMRNSNMQPAWYPADVTKIAKAILLMEKDSLNHESAQLDSTGDAFSLLLKFFAGEYNSYSAIDHKLKKLLQFRTLNQLFRMLKKCPGTLSKLTSPYSEEPGPITDPIPIHANAFNPLVEGIVERHGSAAGKELWELWCSEVRHQDWVLVDEGLERVVKPNLETLRIILRPINERRKVQREKRLGKQPKLNVITGPKRERQIVQWACQKFEQMFGLSLEEIRNEIPEGWLPNSQVDSDSVVGSKSLPL